MMFISLFCNILLSLIIKGKGSYHFGEIVKLTFLPTAEVERITS